MTRTAFIAAKYRYFTLQKWIITKYSIPFYRYKEICLILKPELQNPASVVWTEATSWIASKRAWYEDTAQIWKVWWIISALITKYSQWCNNVGNNLSPAWKWCFIGINIIFLFFSLTFANIYERAARVHELILCVHRMSGWFLIIQCFETLLFPIEFPKVKISPVKLYKRILKARSKARLRVPCAELETIYCIPVKVV